jgi:hypothetical protein
MLDRLSFFLIFCLLFTTSIFAQDDEPKNILNLPAFGFLTYPESWRPLWDHPYAPAVQNKDGTIIVRLQTGDTLENPLTIEAVGTDPLKVLDSLNLDMISAPREIHFGDEESIALEGVIVETKLDEETNRLLVLALPPYQDYWSLITLDAPAKDWKAVLPLAEEILKTFQYIPNAPLLRVVLGYDLPEGAVLRRHELAALEVISQRLHGLDLETPFTVHLLPDQTVEIGFYGGIKGVAEVTDWVRQVGFLELVDFSNVEMPANYVDTQILTTGLLTWQAENQPASAPSTHSDDETQLHPITHEPFETVITGTDFSEATASLSDTTEQWEFTGQIAEEAQDTLKTFTHTHIGEAMALVLDGHVLMTPLIQSDLSEALVLSGVFPEEGMKRLAALVNSGPLPVPMVVETIELLE